MARTPETIESRKAADGSFLEIVNWKAAQPNMPDRDAPWLKLYTSLLENDAFESLDDTARMLLIALWLYAAKSGRHIFPADPKWLRRRIPMLNSDPDWGPLLGAKDAYGTPRPFVRIVDKEGIYNVVNSTERDREREKTEKETKPLRVSEKKKKEKKRIASASADAVLKREQSQSEKKKTEPETQPQTQHQRHPKSQSQSQGKTENPQNPKESESLGAARASSPKAPSLVLKPDPCQLGKIPIWWSDPACKAFSYAVFEALGMGPDPESPGGIANRGTFAAWLFGTRAKFPASQWPEIEAAALAKAREIRKYGKSARKPGAVWLNVMHKMICARAGPVAEVG